jgi:hypothetical protein
MAWRFVSATCPEAMPTSAGEAAVGFKRETNDANRALSRRAGRLLAVANFLAHQAVDSYAHGKRTRRAAAFHG